MGFYKSEILNCFCNAIEFLFLNFYFILLSNESKFFPISIVVQSSANRNVCSDELRVYYCFLRSFFGYFLKNLNKLAGLVESVINIDYCLQITPREQNAQAYINSGFLFKFNPHTHFIEETSIVYGNINPSFTHAYDTEKFLIGQHIFNNHTLQAALHFLEKEINPDVRPPYPPPFARKKVALGLFYKVSRFSCLFLTFDHTFVIAYKNGIYCTVLLF